jgi:hypothetical protein
MLLTELMRTINVSLSGLSTYYSTGGIENINGGTTSSGFVKVVDSGFVKVVVVVVPPVTFTLFHFVTLVVLPLLLSSKQDNLEVSSFVPFVII